MTPVCTLESLRRFLHEHRLFLLVGHEDPDGDCITSQVALGRFLIRMGSEVVLYSEGPFDRPEIAPYETSFTADSDHPILSREPACVVLDCSTPARTGRIGSKIEKLRTLVIDHHSSGTVFGNLRYVDPRAPSVTYLIQQLIERLGHKPDENEARLLLLGLCSDTDFFRHLDTGSAEVFAAVERLVAAGASPSDTYWMLYGGRKISSRRLLGRLLDRTLSVLDGRVLATYQTRLDTIELDADQRGMMDLYRLLQTTTDNEAVIFVREESDGTCSVSLRSRSDLDVGEIAASIGGGGHSRAAGATVPGHPEQVVADMIRAVVSLMEKCKEM